VRKKKKRERGGGRGKVPVSPSPLRKQRGESRPRGGVPIWAIWGKGREEELYEEDKSEKGEEGAGSPCCLLTGGGGGKKRKRGTCLFLSVGEKVGEPAWLSAAGEEKKSPGLLEKTRKRKKGRGVERYIRPTTKEKWPQKGGEMKIKGRGQHLGRRKKEGKKGPCRFGRITEESRTVSPSKKRKKKSKTILPVHHETEEGPRKGRHQFPEGIRRRERKWSGVSLFILSTGRKETAKKSPAIRGQATIREERKADATPPYRKGRKEEGKKVNI